MCDTSYDIDQFYNKKESKDGKHIYCKTCMKEEKKQYYNQTKEERADYYKNYREKNQEYFNNYCNNHYHSNKELYREWNKNKYDNDLGFKLKHVTSARISSAIKTYNTLKNNRTIEYLGCNMEQYIPYLEKMFTSKMNWDNYGTYWEIDHIKPCASFNLENEQELYECFHYLNTQPLEKTENREKSDKI